MGLKLKDKLNKKSFVIFTISAVMFLKALFIIPANENIFEKHINSIETDIAITVVMYIAALLVSFTFAYVIVGLYDSRSEMSFVLAAFAIADPLTACVYDDVLMMLSFTLCLLLMLLIKKRLFTKNLGIICAMICAFAAFIVPCTVFSYIPMALAFFASQTADKNDLPYSRSKVIKISAFSAVGAAILSAVLVGVLPAIQRFFLLLGGKEACAYSFKYTYNFDDFISKLFAGANNFTVHALDVLKLSLPVAVIIIAVLVVAIKEKFDISKKYKYVKNKKQNNLTGRSKSSKWLDKYNALTSLINVIASPIVIAFVGALFCKENAALSTLNLTAVTTLMTYIKKDESYISSFVSCADMKVKKFLILFIFAVIYMASYTFYFCRGNDLYGYITDYLV